MEDGAGIRGLYWSSQPMPEGLEVRRCQTCSWFVVIPGERRTAIVWLSAPCSSQSLHFQLPLLDVPCSNAKLLMTLNKLISGLNSLREAGPGTRDQLSIPD